MGGWDVGVEVEDMSFFDIPTVAFWLMNFHFRGQSMSVTATLVLWPKTAYSSLRWWKPQPAEKFICYVFVSEN